MTDSDPSDYECSNCIGTPSKTFYSYYECDGCYEPIGAVEYVPVEALEDLADKWKGHGLPYCIECADELEALITDYNE